MRTIIRQRDDAPGLPDLRNLGTILRILLAVNGSAALVAFARASSVAGFAAEWTVISGIVEPHLLLQLAIMWAAAPWLGRAGFGAAAAAIGALGVLVAIVIEVTVGAMVPQGATAGAYVTHIVFTLVASAALLAYFRLRAKALSPAIAEARLQALQARIRPHFLFNSINGVLSLIRSDPMRAEEALHDLADLFRVLMRDNRELTPLAQEVELCRQYLDLEKLRLGDRLDVDWNIKSMPGDAMVPPLLLQPLLENAVYHGIEPSTSRGTISINIFLSRAEVHAILRNPYNAQGKRHQNGNKMALANVRERLALHFDAEARLESRVLPDAYEVHIRLPYRTIAPLQPADRVEPRIPRAKPAEPGEPPRRAGIIPLGVNA